MLRLQIAAGTSFILGTTVNLSPLTFALTIMGSLGGVAAFLLVGSQRTKNTVDSMNVLFENQRAVNKERLEVVEYTLAELREKLRECNGNREELEEQRQNWERERTLLKDQIRGLDMTIKQLRHEPAPD